MTMAAHAHNAIPPGTAPPVIASRRRRVDAGVVQLSQRDIDGLLLCGEHFGAPFDLLAAALRVEPERLSALTARWRRAGFAATGRLGPGPKWCWLTRDGMTATGLGFRAGPPALGRLAHVRAILAARLWMEASPAWHDGRPWWHSERRLLAGQPAADRAEHLPDAEIHWPSLDGSPYAGQIWAIEVELTPKSAGRTMRIMTGLLAPMQYALVVYLTAARARPVVTRAAGSLPPGEQSRLVVRDLPGYAFAPRGSLPAGGPIVAASGPSCVTYRGCTSTQSAPMGRCGARAVRPQFDAQPVGAPGELHDLGRVEDQHLAVEAIPGRTDEPQRRARPALPDDLLGIPGGQVLRFGHGPPDLLARVRQPAGEGEHPPVPLAGQRAEFRVIHALSSVIHVVEVGFQRTEASGPGGAVGRQPLVDLAERFGPEPVHAPLGVGPHLDQARLAQHPQVLGHAGLAEAQRGDQVADGLVLLAQQVQDAAPVRLGQNLEHIANISV